MNTLAARGRLASGRLPSAKTPSASYARWGLQQSSAGVALRAPQSQKCVRQRQRQHSESSCGSTRAAAAASQQDQQDVQPVPDLPAPSTDLECDRRWIAAVVTAWLDEEWTPLEVHAQLGQAAGDAYVTCRRQGDDDMSSLVVGLASELLSFNYRETFTSAFEVSNKVVEMLMMRQGVDVCCTTDEDVERLQRFSSS